MKTSLRRFIAALAGSFVASALAQPIQVSNAGLEIAETRYFLNADFHLDLTAQLLEALNGGVSLGFLVEFQLTRRRWYWFDEKTAFEKLELRLSYLPLAQQYRLSSGTLHQNFPTLAEALQALGTVHGWPVNRAERLKRLGERREILMERPAGEPVLLRQREIG